MITEFHLLDTGFCTVQKRFAYGTGSGSTVCHAVCALLHHSTHGWFLFDTGYAPRVLKATVAFPYRLYQVAIPLHLREIDTAVRQIARYGLTSDDIKTIVVSHFHADHIGGLHDFNRAQFVASRTAYGAIQGRTGFAAVRRAFLPSLLPDDFATRTLWQENLPVGKPLPAFPVTHDLFGDGTCLLVPLPGHANGQIGLWAQATNNETLFLVADAVYSTQAIHKNIPFHPITRLFTDNTQEARATLQTLHDFHRYCPNTLLLPTHCPEVFARCSL